MRRTSATSALRVRRAVLLVVAEVLESRQLLTADLTGAVGTVARETFVPGEVVRVPLYVDNLGDTPVDTDFNLALSLTGSSGTFPVFQQRVTRPLAAGEARPGRHDLTVASRFTVPTNAPAGAYNLQLTLDVNDEVDEEDAGDEGDDADNVVSSVQPFTVVWRVGAVDGRTVRAITVTDVQGRALTLGLSGGGVAEITPSPDDVDVFDIDVTGSGSRSKLSIAGDAVVGKVTTNGQLSGFTSKGIGTFDLAVAGAVRTLTVDTRPPRGIAIAPAAVGGDWDIGGAVKSLLVRGGSVTAGRWDIDGEVGSFTAPAIATEAGDASAFSATIAGAVKALKLGAWDGGVLAAASLGSMTIGGNVARATLLAGADLGDDATLGGAAVDTFAAGAIKSVTVRGSMTAGSFVGAGLTSGDATIGNAGDGVVGGVASKIGSITVAGALSDDSAFYAGAFPRSVKLDGAKLDPTGDARFRSGGPQASGAPPVPAESIGLADDAPFLEEGALTVTGVDPTRFNATTSIARFTLSSFFDADASSIAVTLNGAALDTSTFTRTATDIAVPLNLTEGRNNLSFKAADHWGRPVYHEAVLWAGSHTVTLNVTDGAGQTYGESINASLTLIEDQTVTQSVQTASGTAVFENVPDRTVLAEATGDTGLYGSVGGTGAGGTFTIQVAGLGEPNTPNLAFETDLTGWQISGEAIAIVPHDEGAAPATAEAGSTSTGLLSVATASSQSFGALAEATAGANNDLKVETSGEGPRSAAHTFNTTAGVSEVKVRYRFITSEIAGGYFGSKYNDYFSILIASTLGQKTESNSMNGLGLAAFDASGATTWREVTLSVRPEGDVVRFNATVANVGDGSYDSQVIIDDLSEVKAKVKPKLAWNGSGGGLNLSYTLDNGTEPLGTPIDVPVYFASGTGFDNKIGAPIFTKTIAAGTASGSYGPFPVKGNFLKEEPAATTHLIAAVDKSSVGFVKDVQLVGGANANMTEVTEAMRNALRDFGRLAGQSQVTITSTVRTFADQARAMFDNLMNPQRTIQQNITVQLGIYASAGDSVIEVFNGFATQNANNRGQLEARATQIRAAMEQRISSLADQGLNVSNHLASSSRRAIDLSSSQFVSNLTLFVTAVQADTRVLTLIDERNTNQCYHLEFAR